MKTSDKSIVRLIVNQCKSNGIRHIVFSPGSRNAPFAITFDHDSFFQSHVIHDERVAGFFALGIVQMLNEPVALCCTSGSAVVNYFPAITEAFYRKLPLLVLSADRPKSLINKGHGQTIMQNDIFGKHVVKSITFEDHLLINTEDIETCQRLIKSLYTKPRGPVHFNIHLNEPLYSTIETEQENIKSQIIKSTDDSSASNDLLKSLNGKKILVLCGQNSGSKELNRALVKFNENTNVVVLNENTSGLNDSSFINCIDRTLNSIDLNNSGEFVPEILISIGDAIVSKRIKSFFIQNAPKTHIAINHSKVGIDLFLRLDIHLKMDPTHFFNQINATNTLINTTNFESKWRALDLHAKDLLDDFYKTEKSNTDIQVFYLLNQYIQDHSIVHMANSSVVRYMQLFDPIKSVQYFANRGTSGIDGSMSTAVGSAIALPNQNHLFVTGDISFIYDSNSMWIQPFPSNLKIILINNAGGGIFRIIEGPSTSDQLENYFEAHHQSDLAKIAEGYGLSVKEISAYESYERELKNFIQNDSIQLLIFKTDRKENPLALNRLFKFLKYA